MENAKHPLVFCDGLPIGQQLRTKRAHDQLTLVALQQIIKVPKSVLSEIELGKRLPKKYEKVIDEYLYHMYFDNGEFVERWD